MPAMWMGHKHLSTTERYADYAPRSGEAELVTAAFAASHGSNMAPISPDPSRPETTQTARN
jgi:hypothetical protein